MKTYLPFVLCAFMAFAANDDDNTPSPSNCDFDTIISAELYDNGPDGFLNINSMDIEGDCLTLNFSSSGCSGDTWIVKLVDSEDVVFSFPPQRNLRLSLDNSELCDAVITQELSFDVSNLQIASEESVRLNIVNSDGFVLYEY